MSCSVLILTKNEESNICACIESCRLFATEFIVIDDMSDDRTVELAIAAGAHVFKKPMNGNFGAQQAFSITKANCNWIFFIDADERCTPELTKEIQYLVQEKPANAYVVRRINHFKGQPLKHGPLSPDWVLRLMPREGASVEGLVHQTFNSTAQKKCLSGEMLHFTYNSWEQYEAKMQKYATLAALKYFNEGRRETSVLVTLCRSGFAFLKMYLFKKGFLDGRLGFLFCLGYTRYTFNKYRKLQFLTEHQNENLSN